MSGARELGSDPKSALCPPAVIDQPSSKISRDVVDVSQLGVEVQMVTGQTQARTSHERALCAMVCNTIHVRGHRRNWAIGCLPADLLETPTHATF